MATAERKAELVENYQSIMKDIKAASSQKTPRLVLVSKLKPPSDIRAVYEGTGHKVFGENYIQELIDKARQLPPELEWHFIGALQSNKCKALAAVENLDTLETLDTRKKADLLEKALAEGSRKLKVYLQVNTSAEDSKSGLPPALESSSQEGSSEDSLFSLAKHIIEHCPHLLLKGVMTIGSWEASHEHTAQNPDFVSLKQSRDHLADHLGWERQALELSMGMSADFEAAIQAGSDNVRVGSRAFGKRPSKEEAKAKRDLERGNQ